MTSAISVRECADRELMHKELGQGDRLLPDDLPLRGEEEESR